MQFQGFPAGNRTRVLWITTDQCYTTELQKPLPTTLGASSVYQYINEINGLRIY